VRTGEGENGRELKERGGKDERKWRKEKDESGRLKLVS